MAKLTRDQERFKSCLKKSKSKSIVMDRNSSGERFWYFPDVDQTGWHHSAISEMLEGDMIRFRLMDSGYDGGQPKYSGGEWVAK